MSEQPVVFIVDDDQAVRDGIADLVAGMGYDARPFVSAEAFLEAYDSEQQHGCLILDVRMPGMDGLELQAELIARKATLPIIIITGHGDIPMSVQSLKMGAVDFIEKPFREQVLWQSIKKATERAKECQQEQIELQIVAEKLAVLSQRERQVADLLIAGKSDKQIAQEMSISVRGVAFHRNNVLEKTEAGSVVELAKLMAK